MARLDKSLSISGSTSYRSVQVIDVENRWAVEKPLWPISYGIVFLNGTDVTSKYLLWKRFKNFVIVQYS